MRRNFNNQKKSMTIVRKMGNLQMKMMTVFQKIHLRKYKLILLINFKKLREGKNNLRYSAASCAFTKRKTYGPGTMNAHT